MHNNSLTIAAQSSTMSAHKFINAHELGIMAFHALELPSEHTSHSHICPYE